MLHSTPTEAQTWFLVSFPGHPIQTPCANSTFSPKPNHISPIPHSLTQPKPRQHEPEPRSPTVASLLSTIPWWKDNSKHPLDTSFKFSFPQLPHQPRRYYHHRQQHKNDFTRCRQQYADEILPGVYRSPPHHKHHHLLGNCEQPRGQWWSSSFRYTKHSR